MSIFNTVYHGRICEVIRLGIGIFQLLEQGPGLPWDVMLEITIDQCIKSHNGRYNVEV
jgi:hypothetical protein